MKRPTKKEINELDLQNFLKKLTGSHLKIWVVDSPVAFGSATPFLISSKVYRSGNNNLIKYVLTHEFSHKKLRHAQYWLVYFLFLFLFLMILTEFKIPVVLILLLSIILSRASHYFHQKFEDQADQMTVKILGKENTKKAIEDLFILNGSSLKKGDWLKSQAVINRDFPGRMKAINNYA